MRKRLVCFLLTIVLSIGILSPISLNVRASTYSGTCGSNLTWALDGSTGILRISGTGAMGSYSSSGAPWYSYRSAIKSVLLPYGISTIGKCAFSGCSGITEIELPETVKTIEAAAFLDTSISTITIPKGVTKMYSNTGLAGLDKTPALYGASMLRTVIFENGIQTIPERALQDCSQISTIVFPESVTTIGGYAFSGCTGMEKFILPEGLKTIGEYAFNGCTRMTQIDLPTSLNTIGKCAFNGCSGITEIELPETVKTIEAAAFLGTSISTITIPKSVTKMYSNTGLAGLDKTSALYGASMLRTVIFENGIQTIPERALQDCSQISTIVFPESVTTIGGYAFSGCTRMEKFILPEGLKTIGEYAFNGCTRMTQIDLPTSLNTIGEYAFNGCSGITKIELPKMLKTIEAYAFSGTCISTITIPKGVTTLFSNPYMMNYESNKVSAFDGASMLRTVVFDSELQSIPARALKGCSQISSAIIMNPSCTISDAADTLGVSGTTVIYGYANSTAQSYANRYNYAFVDIEGNDKISSSTQRPMIDFEWLMYVSDRETKEGLSGATISFKSGDKTATATSDAEGIITGTTNMNTAAIQISKEGYRNILFYDGVLSSTTRAFSLEKGAADDFYIAFAELDVPSGDNKDVRNEQVVVDITEAKMYKSSIHGLTTYVNTNGKKVSAVYLKQGDNAFPGIVTEIEGLTRAHFKMPEIYGNLVPNQALYLYAVATDGTVSEAYKLNFKLTEGTSATAQETDMFRTDKDGNITGFKLGTEMKVPIPENVPIIGGGEFGMSGLDWVPVQVAENEDGTKIIGIGIANLGEDEDTGAIGNKFGDLEAWMEDFEKSKKVYDQANKVIENMKWNAKVRQTSFAKPTEFTVTDNIKPEMDMYGYLKLSADNKLIGGGIMFSAKLEYTYEQQIFIGYFPAYFKVGVGFGASFDGTFYMWDDENVRAPMEGKIETELSGKVGAGIGIAKVFTVGVWGEPKFIWTVDFPDVKSVLKLKGGAGIELKILGSTIYKTDWLDTAGAEIEIYNSEKDAKSATTKSSLQTGLFGDLEYTQTVSPVSREYAETTSPWLGESSGKRSIHSGLLTLQSGIYNDAEPILMTTDEGQLILLWLTDNTERDAVNRTMLVYSVYDRDNNSWSAPVPVCDDGCGDFYPAVSGNYVVWHKSTALFTTESTLEDMARNSDIYLAKWNGTGFDSAISITNNDGMDTTPALYAEENSVTVAWVRNDNNNIFGNDTSNSIVFTTVENGVVSEETVIAEGLNAVTELSCGKIGEQIAVAYVVEGDNDLNTNADWELNLYCHKEITAVTDNDVLDSHPVFYNIDGKSTLYWYSGGNVVRCSDTEDLTAEIVLSSEEYSVGDDFLMTSNGDSVCITWSVTGAQQAIWGAYYENGVWTKATQLIGTEANVLYPSSVMLEDGSILTAFNNTRDNYDENGAYVSSSADLCVIATERFAETEVQSVFFDESKLLTDGKVVIHADLYNAGTTEVKTVHALVTQADGTVILDEQIPCDLAMNQTQTFTLTCIDQGSLGKKDWTVQLIAENETDTTDNSSTISIGGADLEIDCETKSVSSSYGQVIAEVKNLGAETATNIVVSLVALDGEVIDTVALDNIAAGGITVVNFRLHHIPYASGNKEFYLKVESAEDTNAGNNEDYVVLPYSLYTSCQTHTWDSGLVIKEASCTEEGAVVFTCTACAEQKTEPTALKHDYETITVMPTDESRGYDKHVCSICGSGYRDNYIAVVSEFDDSLTIRSTTLLLESDLSLKFYVLDSILEGWESPYVAFKKAIYDTDGNVIDYKIETVTDYTPATIGDGSQYRVYTFRGISSMEMGSAVSATLYAQKDGLYYKGQTFDYSVLQYATNMLAKTSDSRVKTLLVDLLNYGSEAQIYFGYNTANLANANLTEDQRAYGTQGVPKLTSCRELIKNEGATVSFKTCSLLLEEKVTINYYLSLASYNGDVNDLEVQISYVDTKGDMQTVVIDSTDLEYKLYGDGNYYYVANFDKLYATQMTTVCTAEVFSKTSGERISNTVVYSIESYAYSKQSDTTLSALINAMMKYGNAAASYFQN